MMVAVGALVAAVALLVLPPAVNTRARCQGWATTGSRSACDPVAAAGGDGLALAAALDLLAAGLRAGLPVAAAAAAVAASLGPPLGVAFSRAADLLSLGAEPQRAWQSAAADEAQLAPLARLVQRSDRSGAALADAVAELAGHQRATAEAAAVARAARATTLVAAPLGLCFLPGFVCLGIVPVVLGLAERMLSGGAP